MIILKSLVSNMHYYQHHIGDFIKDTSFLTNEEVGIYMKLIWLYYDTEEALPNDIFTLSMKTNARESEDVVEGLLNMYFKLVDDQWHHTRCNQIIFEYQKQIETASRAGKASAEKRKLNGSSTPVQPTNNHKPITNNHKPIKYTPPIPAELLAEWLAVRKKKPVTERVFNAIEKQARLLGWSAEQAIIKCCEQGWIGFDASWVDKPKSKSYQDERASVSNAAFGNLLNKYSIEEKEITSD